MKRILHTCKKTAALVAALALAAAGSAAFAQEADDGFVVPLDADFSTSGADAGIADGAGGANGANGADGTASARGASLTYGLWLQTQSYNEALIRNVSDGTKSGYEFDNAHFKTEANWWFWGNVRPNVLLSAEIAVLDFDKTLYQANTYGDNVPDVTWGDGAQSVAALFASPFKNGNDEGVGYFKKMGVNLSTPLVVTRFGYGDLDENNGMSEFDGIFNVIDFKDYNGYTELKNGTAWQQFGDIRLDLLAAFSDKVGTYGTYNYIDVRYADRAEVAFTLAGATTEEELFFYDRTNTNAASAYLAVRPLERLKIEAHVLGTFGSDVDLNAASAAGAFRIGWQAATWNVSLMQSIAGENVNSVWGSDGTYYDDINADTATTQLDAKKAFETAALSFALGLDQGVTVHDSDNLSDGLLSFRTEPYADFDLNPAGIALSGGVYGVWAFDRLAKATSSDRELASRFDEAGVELVADGAFLHVQKLVFDYALSNSYGDWKSGAGYPLAAQYHSFMLNTDVTERLNVTTAVIVRADKTDDDTTVPLAFALGASVKRLPLPGKPMLWTHFTYGMFPYTDTNYELRRRDAEQDKSPHRTYLLNDVTGYATISRISFGLIWNL